MDSTDDRITRLADELEARGDLTSPYWRRALFAVPRHRFAPDRVWACPLDGAWEGLVDRAADPSAWWEAVYSNTILITQFDGGARDLTAGRGVATSSCSAPSAVIDFLGRLRPALGHNVLDIGTGTGWTAGLLSYWVGDEAVTTIEIDPELTDQASKNLAAAGIHPTVLTGDGAGGASAHAPFDRVHATCAVRSVPYAWVDQTRLGGIILTPVRLGYGWGQLARLHVTADGRAIGRFVAQAGYMMLRPPDPKADNAAPAEATPSGMPAVSATGMDPRTVTWDSHDADLAIAAQVPDCSEHLRLHSDNSATFELDHSDGSRAKVEYQPGQTEFTVRQYGPRRLWDEVASAYLWWLEAGRPQRERFGLTVTPNRQDIWLDEPGNVLAREK